VNALALLVNLSGSSRRIFAISGTRGSDGLGSARSEHTERRSLEMVRAGLQASLRMSMHIPPLELMFGW
jgi:hypothetical protein